ncbi:unnamed protein product [Amoebophrya sp. A120]|nr:unnamed protein product [Amoebophrya sp. A120]|eukprot:GSA120T00017189001.1
MSQWFVYGSEPPALKVQFGKSDRVRRILSEYFQSHWDYNNVSTTDPKDTTFYLYGVGRRKYPEFRGFPLSLRPDRAFLDTADHDLNNGAGVNTSKKNTNGRTLAQQQQRSSSGKGRSNSRNGNGSHHGGGRGASNARQPQRSTAAGPSTAFLLPEELYARWDRPVKWSLYDHSRKDVGRDGEEGVLLMSSTNETAFVEDAIWPSGNELRVTYYKPKATGVPQGREEKLSRYLSNVLRHKAGSMGLNIRPDGYVSVEDIFWHKQVRKQFWPPLTPIEIDWLVKANQKQRFQLELFEYPGMMIRCTQGHSVAQVTVEQSCQEITSVEEYFAITGTKPRMNNFGTTSGAAAASAGGAGAGSCAVVGKTRTSTSSSFQPPRIHTRNGMVNSFGVCTAPSDSVRGEIHMRQQVIRRGLQEQRETDRLQLQEENQNTKSAKSRQKDQKRSSRSNPPATVIHGTYEACLKQILESGGLKTMGRNEIHFSSQVPSVEENTMVVSGMRGDCDLVIEVDLARCLRHEVKFFYAQNGVILSKGRRDSGILCTAFFSNVYLRSEGPQNPHWRWKAYQWDQERKRLENRLG